MRKRIFNLLKITVISVVLGLGLSFIITNFLHSKMKTELDTYLSLVDDMNYLNDTYSLCTGLLKTNPTQTNIDSCNYVFKNIENKVNQIKEECPYISFYTKYVSKVQE